MTVVICIYEVYRHTDNIIFCRKKDKQEDKNKFILQVYSKEQKSAFDSFARVKWAWRNIICNKYEGDK